MKNERGGTVVGFIVGVVVGLGAALAVAVYVTKVPVPFMNKSQSRSADQDAAEAQKNKNWDPNAPMYGKNPAPATPVNTVPAAESPTSPKPAIQPAEPKAEVKVDAKTEAKGDAKSTTKPESKTDAKVSADPLGDLAKAKAASVDGDVFTYWVQVGSFRAAEDAESQRAKLSLNGIDTKISERELSGKPIYRLRVGPFEKKDDAEKSKEKLDKAGLDTTLVRVQR